MIHFRSLVAILSTLIALTVANAQDTRLPMPDPATDRAEFVSWQSEARGRLIELLGIPRTKVALDAEARGQIEVDGLIIEKWVLTMEPGSRAPALLYRPKEAAAGRLPAMVLTFGHGDSKSATATRSQFRGVG